MPRMIYTTRHNFLTWSMLRKYIKLKKYLTLSCDNERTK
nr:MAG TPA: hypothetical protein [Caudoviricetes sp.]DAV22222.1 MAG TPA: hypothetical protein [Caudoviricetes sp.]